MIDFGILLAITLMVIGIIGFIIMLIVGMVGEGK